MERNRFTIPSFKIYGGIAGLIDFGPPGFAVKLNITQLWRSHFVMEEDMPEVWHSKSKINNIPWVAYVDYCIMHMHSACMVHSRSALFVLGYVASHVNPLVTPCHPVF